MKAGCFTFIVYPWLFERKVIALNEDEARRKLKKMLTKEQQSQQKGIVCTRIESIDVPNRKAELTLIGMVIVLVAAFLVFLIVVVKKNNEHLEKFRAECAAKGGISYEPFRTRAICLDPRTIIKP